jgi:protein-S-isoprenylcysteine O-methyltransferase Ste14
MNAARTDPADRPGAIPWPPILILAAVIGAWLLGSAYPLPWPGTGDIAARIIGVGFGVAGAALIVWAAVTFGRHCTTFMPTQGAEALITDGPFRFRRNPIYLGEVLIILGLAELTQNIWFVLTGFAFAASITVLQIIPEERHLEARFGQAYRDWAAQTRRWI